MAQREMNRKIPDRNFLFPASEMSIGPTRLANMQEAQRDYLSRSYGIDVTLFWANLQNYAAANEKFAALLENAKTRLDFSVALTAVSGIFTLGWLVCYGTRGGSWVVYILFSILALLVSTVAYRLVSINYQSFAETVRAAVELFRFDLLKGMHLPLPADSAAEQAIWTGLAERLAIGTDTPLTYEHPAA